jgi:hypothetical protein
VVAVAAVSALERSFRVKRWFLLGVIFSVVGVFPEISQAQNVVDEGERTGDGRLVVDPISCMFEWQDQNYCGPSLVVRLPPLFGLSDGFFAGKAILTGPSGAVPLQFGESLSFQSNRGLSVSDRAYWGDAFEKHVPTDLPFGEYTYEVDVEMSGKWICSIYSKSGCSFYEGHRFQSTYQFSWNGSRIDIARSPFNYGTTVLRVRRGAVFSRRQIFDAAFMLVIWSSVSVELTNQSPNICKLVNNRVTTIRSGRCRISVLVNEPGKQGRIATVVLVSK